MFPIFVNPYGIQRESVNGKLPNQKRPHGTGLPALPRHAGVYGWQPGQTNTRGALYSYAECPGTQGRYDAPHRVAPCGTVFV